MDNTPHSNPLLGIGNDIIEIARIRDTLGRFAETFVNKTFTDVERAYCESYKDPAARYAGHFAAKEAVAKALGCGFGERLAWKDVEINHDPQGKPFVKLSEHVDFTFRCIHISISHCREYATAMVIIE